MSSIPCQSTGVGLLLAVAVLNVAGFWHCSASDSTGSSTASGQSSAVAAPEQEVCQMETFHASCGPDEVIWIQTSQLGRLKIGRCVKENNSNYPLNCSLDVKPEMDSYCSGRQRCDVRIDDANFRRLTPCHRDLKVHLWASYQCRKVTVPKAHCRLSGSSYTVNVQSGGGWLASQMTEVTGCGLTETPWIIQVGAGQRINVTMYDMSHDATSLRHDASADQRHQYPRTCRVFATIREPSRGTTSTVCGSQGQVANVFTSDGDRIELRVMTSSPRSSAGSPGQLTAPGAGGAAHSSAVAAAAVSTGTGNTPTTSQLLEPYFLLRYDVLGCADPVPVPGDDRTLRRRTSADTMMVSCAGSDLTWMLTCVGNEWVGNNIANCSRDEAASVGQPMYPVALSGIVVIIIAVFVSSVILLIGIICIKWRMKKDFMRRQRLCQADYDAAAYGLGSVMTSQGGGKSRMMIDGSYAGGLSVHSELLAGAHDSGSLLGAGVGMPGSKNEYARMRLQQQQQQQRLCSHYTGGPYGFDQSVVGPVGMAYGHRHPQFPSSPTAGSRFAEHIYESPDTLRRENNNGLLDDHYTPTVPFEANAWGPATGPAGLPMRLQQQPQHWQHPGCGGPGNNTPSTPISGVHQVPLNANNSSAVAQQQCRAASPSKDGAKKSKKSAGNYSL